MMLKKVVLVAGGNRGLELKFDGYRKISDTHMANYEDNRKDKLPVPLNIRRKFNNLRYFFMTMMGIWPERLTRCLGDYYSRVLSIEEVLQSTHELDSVSSDIMEADTLFQKCRIQGYEVRGSEIRIIGTFENIEGKPYKPSLPFINEDDDYEFFQEAKAVIEEISNMVVHYMKEENLELEEMRKILLELQQNNPNDVERINKQTDEENYIELMNKFEGQAIVFPLEGSDLEKALESYNPEAKVVSKKTIDSSKFEKVDDMDKEKVDEKEEVKPFKSMTMDEIKEKFPVKEEEIDVGQGNEIEISDSQEDWPGAKDGADDPALKPSSFFDEEVQDIDFNSTEKRT